MLYLKQCREYEKQIDCRVRSQREIYELTSREKREQGYEVYLINFSNMALSDMYNSIDYVGLDEDAEKFATTLVLGGEEGQQSGDSFGRNKRFR